ncbi:MAG: outer membrane lipoprotein SlyB [Candidatus Midichloriaceae bacterium]|jgi:outer membrane lipoprotein SlyB
MKIVLKVLSVCLMFSLIGCSRDLSDNMYLSDQTLSFTLEGKIVSTRQVVVKENDKFADNKTGMAVGALGGAAVGSTMGGGSGKIASIAGMGIVGGLLGTAIEDSLGKSKGIEYIIKVDISKIKDSYYEGNAALRNIIAAARVNNGLITVVQAAQNPIAKGESVYVIFSDNRTRVIPA